jgi:uncharacterized membrane protein
VSHAIGVFTATFLFAISALAWVDRGGSGRVPLAGTMVMTIFLVVSVIMFISLIQRVGMLQVNRMLMFTCNQGRRIIENLYSPFDTQPSPSSAELAQLPCTQTLLHRGPPRFMQHVHIPVLVEIASENGCIIEFVASVGDALMDSTVILRVLGAPTPIAEKRLRAAIKLGNERTFEQDPKYAIRLLADIAIKALSPAVNDPTTAVQTLDQIEDLLLRLGRRRLEVGGYFDAGNNLRVLINLPTWDDFLDLAFDEIRFYGSTSIQVMRRMKALVNELMSVLPEERRPALRRWQESLQLSVEHSFAYGEDRLAASVEDRQGLGSALRRTRWS